MKRSTLAFAAALGAVLGPQAHAQQEIKITVSAGHAPVFLWVKHIRETMIPAVNRELAKTGKFKVTWNEAYGGTLAKIGSELETIEQGVSDMGIVGSVFHAAKLPLQNVSYVAPFGPEDPRVVSKVINEMHAKIPAMQKSWEKHKQVYLCGFGLDEYGVFAPTPIMRFEDFSGKKFGGAPTTHAWIKGSGAVAVAAGLPSFYNDVKSGVYNGVLIFASAAAAAKLYEVAPAYTKTGFGAMSAGGISMNKARHDKLPPEVKAAFKVGCDEYESAYSKEQFVRAVAAMDVVRANKGSVNVMPDAERARVAKSIENPARAWIETATKAGFPAREVLKAYMDGARREGHKFPRDWDRE
ncbi:MAG: C4-dicarboxylate TRAP transporter substrate-binding protein [Burkholderiales bacterium]